MFETIFILDVLAMFSLRASLATNQSSLERGRVDRHHHIFQFETEVVADWSKLELVKERGGEHQEVSLGQRLAHTHARSHRERNELVRLVLELSFGIEPAIRIECVWIFKVGRVTVDSMDIRGDLYSFWDLKTT